MEWKANWIGIICEMFLLYLPLFLQAVRVATHWLIRATNWSWNSPIASPSSHTKWVEKWTIGISQVVWTGTWEGGRSMETYSYLFIVYLSIDLSLIDLWSLWLASRCAIDWSLDDKKRSDVKGHSAQLRLSRLLLAERGPYGLSIQLYTFLFAW